MRLKDYAFANKKGREKFLRDARVVPVAGGTCVFLADETERAYSTATDFRRRENAFVLASSRVASIAKRRGETVTSTMLRLSADGETLPLRPEPFVARTSQLAKRRFGKEKSKHKAGRRALNEQMGRGIGVGIEWDPGPPKKAKAQAQRGGKIPRADREDADLVRRVEEAKAFAENRNAVKAAAAAVALAPEGNVAEVVAVVVPPKYTPTLAKITHGGRTYDLSIPAGEGIQLGTSEPPIAAGCEHPGSGDAWAPVDPKAFRMDDGPKVTGTISNMPWNKEGKYRWFAEIDPEGNHDPYALMSAFEVPPEYRTESLVNMPSLPWSSVLGRSVPCFGSVLAYIYDARATAENRRLSRIHAGTEMFTNENNIIPADCGDGRLPIVYPDCAEPVYSHDEAHFRKLQEQRSWTGWQQVRCRGFVVWEVTISLSLTLPASQPELTEDCKREWDAFTTESRTAEQDSAAGRGGIMGLTAAQRAAAGAPPARHECRDVRNTRSRDDKPLIKPRLIDIRVARTVVPPGGPFSARVEYRRYCADVLGVDSSLFDNNLRVPTTITRASIETARATVANYAQRDTVVNLSPIEKGKAVMAGNFMFAAAVCPTGGELQSFAIPPGP